LEWETVLADHRGVKGLVTVRSRHRDEVFDPPRHRRPRLVNDAERGITVLDRLRNDAKRDEVVHALEVNLLSFQFQMNAVKALDPAIQVSDRDLCFLELRANRLRKVVDDGVGCLSLGVYLRAQPLVRFRLEIPEV